ncbi:hypothetical protein SLEP1_g13709 [Rubroshorea leprosula]|uniref:mitogen-activated protein kinase n=1 Tax=Rubroshorea leprosula TaxID=152421 RepID=A0AAV5IMK4_9ROSI|nr:hypothetical protein SLEP1_g13709 [Rubroshorea leprosula]
MADATTTTQGNGAAQLVSDFPAVPTHGGQFIQYNIFGNHFEITAKYRPPIMPIGRGAYGIVCSVMNSETNEMVAIKKIANAFDNHMDAKRTLREIKLLRHLDHENVIGIREVIPPPVRREFTDVYIATELMDTDLHQIIRSNQGLSEEHCQYFLYQILRELKNAKHGVATIFGPRNRDVTFQGANVVAGSPSPLLQVSFYLYLMELVLHSSMQDFVVLIVGFFHKVMERKSGGR